LRFTSCEFEFLHAAVVAVFGAEARAQEGFHRRAGEFGSDHARAQADDVRVVVFTASAAETGSLAFAARMPGRLFAAMLMPMPVPQMRIPSAGRVSLISRAVSVCATSG
jgi:hypothetical protein